MQWGSKLPMLGGAAGCNASTYHGVRVDGAQTSHVKGTVDGRRLT